MIKRVQRGINDHKKGRDVYKRQIFCRTIRKVFLEIRIAVLILEGASSIRTISAASMAASEPRPPMAMPMSARERTGASLIPSPMKASFLLGAFSARRRSTISTLSAGKS